ncbi:MAG: hypothetical protein OXG61_05450 [Chloroflexi bacterium]|nr:hypothetical protein [Chloroflexota bacterium]
MVKAAKGEKTQIGKQSTGQGAPPEACRPLNFEVSIAQGPALAEGDQVSAQLRRGRVRVLHQGQIVAWVDDEAIVRAVKDCTEAGGRYEGKVGAVGADGVVIVLEGCI